MVKIWPLLALLTLTSPALGGMRMTTRPHMGALMPGARVLPPEEFDHPFNGSGDLCAGREPRSDPAMVRESDCYRLRLRKAIPVRRRMPDRASR
jgi:hypothetical protein